MVNARKMSQAESSSKELRQTHDLLTPVLYQLAAFEWLWDADCRVKRFWIRACRFRVCTNVDVGGIRLR